MSKFNTIFVVDGITTGIVKIERCGSQEAGEYFNVYLTTGHKTGDLYDDNYYAKLSKEDTYALIINLKCKQITFIGVTNEHDEIINNACLDHLKKIEQTTCDKTDIL